MQSAAIVSTDVPSPYASGPIEATGGTAWRAIIAGAVGAAALSLILLALGSGLGLSSISPWSYRGATSTSVAIGAIVWLLLTAAAASGLGGYLAGRLRPKWAQLPDDESFFRDTAHGFLAWALATIVSAALLTSAASEMVGTAVKGGAAVAGTAAASAAAAGASGLGRTSDPLGYYTDMLFRGSTPAEPGTDPDAIRAETTGILTNALRQGELSAPDKTYLAQLVARRTGVSQQDAEQRVAQVSAAAKAAADAAEAKAQAAAEAARRVARSVALWVFVSLLLGAFCAAFAATVGGRHRGLWVMSR
jgi:hypothetical protein